MLKKSDILKKEYFSVPFSSTVEPFRLIHRGDPYVRRERSRAAQAGPGL